MPITMYMHRNKTKNTSSPKTQIFADFLNFLAVVHCTGTSTSSSTASGRYATSVHCRTGPGSESNSHPAVRSPSQSMSPASSSSPPRLPS
mmetsp:Transcript_8002/g.15551  ORF Transcript_8002/g.15551 Transcript_8002/m.15551 type:complete len:90 (-) Transcript_8002:2-271(-)